MSVPRTVQDFLDLADELVKPFEGYEPSPRDERWRAASPEVPISEPMNAYE